MDAKLLLDALLRYNGKFALGAQAALTYLTKMPATVSEEAALAMFAEAAGNQGSMLQAIRIAHGRGMAFSAILTFWMQCRGPDAATTFCSHLDHETTKHLAAQEQPRKVTMKDPEIHTPAEALQTFPTPAAAAAAVAGDFYPTLGSEAGNPNAGAQPMPAPILHTPTTSDPNAGTLPGN